MSARADHLPGVVVDIPRPAQAEVHHPAPCGPQERMVVAIRRSARADHLSGVGVTDAVGGAIGPAERPEVHHPANGRPHKRMGVAAGHGAIAHRLSEVVDTPRHTRAAAERAKVHHPSGSRPHKRMVVAARRTTPADHLADVIDAVAGAVHSAERPEVGGHPRRLRMGRGRERNEQCETHSRVNKQRRGAYAEEPSHRSPSSRLLHQRCRAGTQMTGERRKANRRCRVSGNNASGAAIRDRGAPG